MSEIYDLIIVGAGPAGLTASIYASRYRLSHLILGKNLGGTITLASKVENFPGFSSLSGAQIYEYFLAHTRKLGGKIETKEVIDIKKEKNFFKISCASGDVYNSYTVIIATGTRRRELGIVGEREFLGKGVSYCTTCDAPFFKNKMVAIVGGANAACSGAIHLASFAKKVYLLYRKSNLRAEPAWVEEIKKEKNVEILYETNILKIEGKERVEKILIDKHYQGKKELLVKGVFIEVGGTPVSEFARKLGVKTDNEGYITTDKNMVTNIPGVFAAGDINSLWRDFQQLIVACCTGAIASYSAYRYLKKNE